MFKKKYIFETENTKYSRYVKNSCFVFFLMIVAYIVTGFYFIVVSKNESTMADANFYKRPPDLIVVFTGHVGRIPYALKIANDFRQSNIFITGVYSRNTVKTFLTEKEFSKQIDTNLLEIDYLARNTVENVISTLRYLRKNNGMKRILVISHDYHIARIRLIINRLVLPTDNYKFFFIGITTDYSTVRNIKILYTEVFKLFRAFAFLLFWDDEITPD